MAAGVSASRGCAWTDEAARGGIDRRLARAAAVVAVGLLVANCGSVDKLVGYDPELGVKASPRVVGEDDPVPKGGGVYKVGSAYTVGSSRYTPADVARYSATGVASWYGKQFHGRRTANGEVYDMASFSAAHPTLPLPSYVRVTNLSNGRSMVVRVNDRGPFSRKRLIDVSSRTADMLGFKRTGVARVRVDYVGPASLEGSDDDRLAATYRVLRPGETLPRELDVGTGPVVADASRGPAGPRPSPEAKKAEGAVLAAAEIEPRPVVTRSIRATGAPLPTARPAATRSDGNTVARVAAMPLDGTTVSARIASSWSTVGEPMPVVNAASAATNADAGGTDPLPASAFALSGSIY